MNFQVCLFIYRAKSRKAKDNNEESWSRAYLATMLYTYEIRDQEVRIMKPHSHDGYGKWLMDLIELWLNKWNLETFWVSRFKWIDKCSLALSIVMMTNSLNVLNSAYGIYQGKATKLLWNCLKSIRQKLTLQYKPKLMLRVTAAFLHHLKRNVFKCSCVLMLILNSKVVILCHKEMNFTPTTDLTSFPIS